MKRGWFVLLLVVGLVAPAVSHAQVSAYGEFTASKLLNGPQGDFLYGVTTGVLVDGPRVKRMVISADIQGRFVGKNGERLDGVTVGPRFAFEMKRMKLSPFAEFMVGFARYNDSHGLSSTDNTWQANGGATKQLSPRWDAVLDYSYAQYGVNNGEYNPKTVSIGAVYDFVKR